MPLRGATTARPRSWRTGTPRAEVLRPGILEGRSGLVPARTTAYGPGMDERVIPWSHGRRLRIVVTDVPGYYERLLEVVAADAQRTDDRERLADDVSAIFNSYVRLSRQEVEGTEEVVLTVV